MVCRPQECMVYSLEDNLKPETQLDAPLGICQRSKDCILQIMAGHIGVDTHGAHFTREELMVSDGPVCHP